jgi:hypothetical protein
VPVEDLLVHLVEVGEEEVILLLNFQHHKVEQVIHLQRVRLKEIMAETVLLVFQVAEAEAVVEELEQLVLLEEPLLVEMVYQIQLLDLL